MCCTWFPAGGNDQRCFGQKIPEMWLLGIGTLKFIFSCKFRFLTSSIQYSWICQRRQQRAFLTTIVWFRRTGLHWRGIIFSNILEIVETILSCCLWNYNDNNIFWCSISMIMIIKTWISIFWVKVSIDRPQRRSMTTARQANLVHLTFEKRRSAALDLIEFLRFFKKSILACSCFE